MSQVKKPSEDGTELVVESCGDSSLECGTELLYSYQYVYDPNCVPDDLQTDQTLETCSIAVEGALLDYNGFESLNIPSKCVATSFVCKVNNLFYATFPYPL